MADPISTAASAALGVGASSFWPLALAPAIPALAQGVTGIVQTQKSKNILEGLNRPAFEIPKAATEALNQARVNASTMYSPTHNNQQQAINQAFANTAYNVNQNATSAPEALAALVGAGANQMNAENQLGAQDAQSVANYRNQLQNELNTYAGWQNQAWSWDKQQPYIAKSNAAMALGNAGMNNTYQAIKGLSGVAAQGLLNRQLTGGLKSTEQPSQTFPATTPEEPTGILNNSKWAIEQPKATLMSDANSTTNGYLSGSAFSPEEQQALNSILAKAGITSLLNN